MGSVLAVSPPLPSIRKIILDKLQPVLDSPYGIEYHGMERSGHYAIASWLQALMPKGGGLCALAGSKEPKFDGHPLGWFSSGRFQYRSAILTYNSDTLPEDAPTRIDHKRVVLSVRDVRNMLASRLRWHEKNKRVIFRTGTTMLHTWKSYAKQALGDADYFSGNCVSIFYDQWAVNEKYRIALAVKLADRFGWADLDIDAGEESRGRVSPTGGGSSFEGTKQAIDKMAVTERWLEYKDNPYFNEVLSRDPEILELNTRLLGEKHG